MRSVVWPPRGENLPAINMASCKKEVDMLIVDMWQFVKYRNIYRNYMQLQDGVRNQDLHDFQRHISADGTHKSKIAPYFSKRGIPTCRWTEVQQLTNRPYVGSSTLGKRSGVSHLWKLCYLWHCQKTHNSNCNIITTYIICHISPQICSSFVFFPGFPTIFLSKKIFREIQETPGCRSAAANRGYAGTVSSPQAAMDGWSRLGWENEI